MAVFQSAGQAEIIRSNQKDENYQSQLRGSIHDIVQTFAGARIWVRWRKELDLFSDVLYFGLTTVAGFQTLGEEYVNILQVDKTKRAVPSVQRRWLLVALHVCAPHLLDRVLAKLNNQLESGYRLAGLSESANNKLLHWLPTIRTAVTFLHRIHIAVFYMRGIFYHLAKRLSGVQYIQVRQTAASQALQHSFHILGWLSAIQLTISICWQAFQLKNVFVHQSETPTEKTSTSSNSEYVDPRWRCSLCLERRRDSTSTPCGHLFCWNCIMEWCCTKPECPICRESFQLSRLVRLQNYDQR